MKRSEIKERRDELWKKMNASTARRSAKKIVELSRPEIVVRDGKKFMKKAWGQELPAGSAEIFFWDSLQILRHQLSSGSVDSYVGGEDGAAKELLINFCEFVLAAADKEADARDALREKEIEEIWEWLDEDETPDTRKTGHD